MADIPPNNFHVEWGSKLPEEIGCWGIIAKVSLNSTQLNSTSISIEAEIALFPVSDKPPTPP